MMVEFPESPKDDDAVSPHLLRLRNEERVELIMAFYRGLKLFRDLARRSRTAGQGFRFNDMDHLIETYLRRVKDSAHRLFRESKRSEADRLLQAIFDMYFGILFHTLLKAKENLRLRENYNIARLEGLLTGLRSTRQISDLPAGVSKLFNRLVEEFQRDSEELQDEMAGARFIFGQLEKIFNHVIQVYQDNPTIIRSLYCHKEFFAELFPRQGIDRVFAQIYPKNGPAEAYCLLGFDFLRSGHIKDAQEALALAVKAGRERHLPPTRLRQLYARYREQASASLHGPGDAALAFQLRLRECEAQPALRVFVGEAPRTRMGMAVMGEPRERALSRAPAGRASARRAVS